MTPVNNNQNTINHNQNPSNNQPPPTGSQNPNIDINSPNHPLFLHPNDHHGLILISKKLIGTENYSSWKKSMMIALNAKNKLKIVTCDLNEPNADSEERAMWDRTNDMIISWILNTISDDISNNLNFVNSASALWAELYKHYAQLDGHRIYQLVNDKVALKQQNCNIEVYYHKSKGLWDEHDALESPYLYECYSNLRGQILLLQPLPTDAKAYSMIRQEEKQKEGILPKPLRSTALSAQTYISQSYKNNNTPRNTTSQYPNRPQTGRRSTFRPEVYCTICSKEGHNSDESYKLKGYLIGHPLHGKYKPKVAGSVNVSDNRNAKVNLVQGQDTATTSTQAESSTSGTDAVFVRMDQLQNQLNQVMLMMQQCLKNPPTGMINSHTIRKHKFIASVMIRFKTAWGLNKRIGHGNLCEGLYIIYPDQPTFTSLTVLSTSTKDNDIILTGNDIYITHIKQHSHKEFSIKDLGMWVRIAMLYSQAGMVNNALKVFDEMLERKPWDFKEQSICGVVSVLLGNG
ncbi:cysteine-rich receptor-like protein kinase 8, partial [Tanacetum coccineum]